MPAISWGAPHEAIDHCLSVLTPQWVLDMISHEALQQRVERLLSCLALHICTAVRLSPSLLQYHSWKL